MAENEFQQAVVAQAGTLNVRLAPGQKGIREGVDEHGKPKWKNEPDPEAPGKVWISRPGMKAVLLSYLDLYSLAQLVEKHKPMVEFYAKRDKAKVEAQLAGVKGIS